MPLIHAFEVSNFLNHRRKSPWMPDWPCNRFLLGGFHAALNIPNGRGKSTMMLMLLAMLAGKTKKLNQLMRTHGAPEFTGSFTHLRVEITHRNPDHEDLLLGLVGPSDGERMVFGIYGNARENRAFDFYAYRGTLDDCPLGVQVGPVIDLCSREEFLDCLRKRPGLFPTNQKERQDEEWRRFIAEHFDSAAIQQQYAYQLANAAEGASTYFDVASKTGNYSGELFYKHLAPELLADVMGSYSEEDERGIEDTIHEKASSVVRARKRTRETARELGEANRVLECLSELDAEVQQIEAAQADLHATRQPLIEELCVLEDAVVTNPIAGSPRVPSADDPDLYLYMLLQRSEWWITDQGLAFLLNESVKTINQRAMRALVACTDITSVQKSQVIDLYCDLARRTPDRGGHSAKLYNLQDALTVCFDAMKNWPEEDSEAVVSQLKAAFAWAKDQADTNPARREIRKANLQLAAIATQSRVLETESASLDEKASELRQEEEGLKSGGMAWEALQKSGYFSEQELADPTNTAAVVASEAARANQGVDDHNKITSEHRLVFLQWQAFHVEYGDGTSPGAQAEDLEQEKTVAEQQSKDAEGRHATQKDLVSGLSREHEQARSTVEQLRQSHSKVLHHLPGTYKFKEMFAGEPSDGLEQLVRSQLDDAKAKQKRCSEDMGALFGAVKALNVFNQAYPNSDPAQWLRAREDARKELINQDAATRMALGRSQELLQRADKHWQTAIPFELRFSGSSTEGLEANVLNELQRAQASLDQDESALRSIQPDLAAIEQFQHRFPNMHPSEWLADRDQKSAHAAEQISANRPRLESSLAQHQVVLEQRAQAEGYDTWFLNEDPYGLAGKVVAQLESARQRRIDFAKALTHIQAELDAVDAFRAEVAEVEPGLWLEQWRASRFDVEHALAEKRGEYERVAERRRILDKEPVVPNATARAATEIAGTAAQPLYAFIESLELNEARREVVLSLFSALIFAPVLSNVEAAAEVAVRLAAADIDVPVLVAGPLAEFCRSGSISYRDGVADSWLVGVKTWPVACLLDPNLLLQERARLNSLLSELLSHIGDLKTSYERFVAQEPFARIAARAQDAIERGIPDRGSELKAQIQQIDEALPALANRASDEAQRTIESRIVVTEVLGLESGVSWDSILHSMAELDSHIQELQSCISAAQTMLAELERDVDQEANAAIAAKAISEGKPSQAEQLRGSIARLRSALPGFEDRVSEKARSSIRAMASLQDLLGLASHASWQIVLEARSKVEEEQAVQGAKLQEIFQSIEELNQSSSIESCAREAAAAIESGVPERHAALVSLNIELGQRMPLLETRASFDALTSIRAMRAVEQELQGRSIDELSLAIEAADTKQGDLSDDLATNQTLLQKLEQLGKKCRERLLQAYSQYRQIDDLRGLQAFADHTEYGPDFMSRADDTSVHLERARDHAQRRAAFDFQGVTQFVESGGSARLTSIQTELGQGEKRRLDIAEVLKTNLTTHEQLRQAQDPLRRAAQIIDESIIRVRRSYLERKKVIPDAIALSPGQLRSHELYQAFHPKGDFLLMDLARSMDQACERLTSEEAEQLQQRYKDADQNLQRHTENFIKLIDKALGDSYLKLPEVARTQLRQARQNPSLVTAMLQATQVSYTENLKVNTIADNHLTEERAGLSSWLTNFTLRLPDNLKTLRSIFSPKMDPVSKTVLRAGFIIEAKVIDSEGIQALIESIIQDVEDYEANDQAKESFVRDTLKRSLRDNIRENFYRKVIVSPRIYLVLPAMSAVTLEMERNMASSGQGIAITFLWILRLSEFISEREIRRQTVGRAQRKRMRDRSTGFTILDGAFSHLSSKNLIAETLKGIEDTTGRFQLIVTVHDPAYQNDFNRFPALVVAREMQGYYMRAWSHLNEIGETDALGQNTLATFQAIRVLRPASTEDSR
ncbi:hypothetical protein PS862_00120 [Pseudomonas fluorescens]|uniref:Uncharacterized protein n=1 Tax=Pseudomonas fluorescens TaxID=294 RepID=A0A5E7G692_PSEFL|nr:hypothetical protein [Pseudomonas fluorescens]VVO47291.1 hypothetical protein PS862_00120 [Pseudomonas fluorescens]